MTDPVHRANMNASEKVAYQYLQTLGYTDSQIEFQSRRSPDFLTSDGKGWEVKLIRQNSITFSQVQINQLKMHSDVAIILVRDAQVKSIKPLNTLPLPGYSDGVRVSVVDMSRWYPEHKPMRVQKGSELLSIRTDPETAEVLRTAADRSGKSLSKFLKDAALEAAKKGE